MDDEGVKFIFIRTHQDSTAPSAPIFDRRVLIFQHWWRVGRCSRDKRRRNHFEDFLRKGGHCATV
jgi:hypothetical protein